MTTLMGTSQPVLLKLYVLKSGFSIAQKVWKAGVKKPILMLAAKGELDDVV